MMDKEMSFGLTNEARIIITEAIPGTDIKAMEWISLAVPNPDEICSVFGFARREDSEARKRKKERQT